MNDELTIEQCQQVVDAFIDCMADDPPFIGNSGLLPYPKSVILYALGEMLNHCEQRQKTINDPDLREPYDKMIPKLQWLTNTLIYQWHDLNPEDKDAVAALNRLNSFPEWALPLKQKYLDHERAANEAFDATLRRMKRRVDAENTFRRMPRTTMTVDEAERILDIVSAALQDQSDPAGQHPVSALQGYDLFDIMTALKLRIANELLLLSRRPDFDTQFAQGLRLYDGIPWQIMSTFVADEQLGQRGAKLVMSAIDPATMQLDQRFAGVETCSSFGDFCRALGAAQSNYWRLVYERIDIDYTPNSPRDNAPVRF